MTLRSAHETTRSITPDLVSWYENHNSMATANPIARTHSITPPSISQETHCIAGILTTVYGLAELPPDIHSVSCIWLLHPRLQIQACMAPLASSTINAWKSHLHHHNKDPKTSTGLIAVSFDQRNHGSRLVEPLANEAWRSGNKTHAQDMFSIYHGTALDTTTLLSYLPTYIFPSPTPDTPPTYTLTQHLVLGVSLGGHAAWHCLLHDPRITTAIIIIGCPDYIRLMTDRARLSRLDTWNKSKPPGSAFLGSRDFPRGLMEVVEREDPAGLLGGRGDDGYEGDITEEEKARVTLLMQRSLKGKRILNMAGGNDKLVPYKCSEPFLSWLKNAVGPGGFFADGGVVLEDIIFEGVGHEMSPGMVEEVHRFVIDTLEQSTVENNARDSKI